MSPDDATHKSNGTVCLARATCVQLNIVWG